MAVYAANCDFIGRFVAVVHDIEEGTGTSRTVATTANSFTLANIGTGGFVGDLRIAGDSLSEETHNADFNRDGDTDDTMAAANSVGFLDNATGQTTTLTVTNDDIADLVVVNAGAWNHLGLTDANRARLSGGIQIFVNPVDGCWGVRTT